MICGRRLSFITIASIGFFKWFTTDFCISIHAFCRVSYAIFCYTVVYAVWYGVWSDYDLVIAHWITMNMPYPVWKCLPYGSTHPPYWLDSSFRHERQTSSEWLNFFIWLPVWRSPVVSREGQICDSKRGVPTSWIETRGPTFWVIYLTLFWRHWIAVKLEDGSLWRSYSPMTEESVRTVLKPTLVPLERKFNSRLHCRHSIFFKSKVWDLKVCQYPFVVAAYTNVFYHIVTHT